jgi:hypothetical protein
VALAVFDRPQLIPPFVAQSPVHPQLLGERDDFVATLPSLDGHLGGKPSDIALLLVSLPLAVPFCENVPIASASFEGFSPGPTDEPVSGVRMCKTRLSRRAGGPQTIVPRFRFATTG